MSTRISTQGRYLRILSSMNRNQFDILRAQEQLSTGRTINRPSDDPIGTSRILLLTRRINETQRHLTSSEYSSGSVDTAAAALQDASDLYSQARTLIIKGMNGALSEEDRKLLANEAELIRQQLLDLSRSTYDGRYLFAGARSDTEPFTESYVGGVRRVSYTGTEESVSSQVGDGLFVNITGSGESIFGPGTPGGVELADLTGLSLGSTANEGSGFEYIDLRHDATDLSSLAGLGITSAGAGADDTILGDQTLSIDATAGTIQLGTGEVVKLPDPSDPAAADFVVQNERGGELHLDLSGYTGVDFNGTITATGSISIDGSSYQAIDFSATDLELKHPGSGAILHVDLTGVSRAGSELATFTGTTNVFDLLEGLKLDLLNTDGLDPNEVLSRLDHRLDELDGNQAALLRSLVNFGSAGEQLRNNRDRLSGVELQLEGLRSSIQDVDISEAIVKMAEAENALQVSQLSGVRLAQNSLLNFIR